MISSLHTSSIFNQLASVRIYEHTQKVRENNLDRCDTSSCCCCWSVVVSLILSRMFFMLLHIHVLILCIAPDGIVVKGKKRRQTRTHVKQKTRDRERVNDVSWTFAYTRMYYKKKHLLLYSFVFLPFSCLLLFFGTFLPSFSRSLVLLVVVLIVIRRY
jgi:hypothetical protein